MTPCIACVNSAYSLIGYDWDQARVFWTLPSDELRVCGACYQNADLLISSGDSVTRLTRNGSTKMELRGRYEALAHSIHVINDDLFGVVDTGNSQVVVLTNEGQLNSLLRPLQFLGDVVPPDAVHLNDFVMTPCGMLGSCFGYEVRRKVLEAMTWERWSSSGYGLVLNLTGTNETGPGRVVGCGFNHPHSLRYVEPNLYLCSSATGVFHVCELDCTGLVREKGQVKVTLNHFLRGAYKSERGWFLGGSSLRHGRKSPDKIEVYHVDDVSCTITTHRLNWIGEIYDILPWDDEILRPIIARNFKKHLL